VLVAVVVLLEVAVLLELVLLEALEMAVDTIVAVLI
jgi:hypothetical protein